MPLEKRPSANPVLTTCAIYNVQCVFKQAFYMWAMAKRYILIMNIVARLDA